MTSWRRRKIRFSTVADTFSRFSPVLNPCFSYRGKDAVQSLEATCAVVGYPKTIGVDQGSEFISRDLDLWAYANDVTLDFSRPGKPTDNAYIEALNGRFRAKRLNPHWFLTLPACHRDLGRETLTAGSPEKAYGSRRIETLPLAGNNRGSTSMHRKSRSEPNVQAMPSHAQNWASSSLTIVGWSSYTSDLARADGSPPFEAATSANNVRISRLASSLARVTLGRRRKSRCVSPRRNSSR